MLDLSRRLLAFGLAISAVVATPAFAQTTQPAKAEGRTFRYGVASHLGRYNPADFAKLIDAADRLGVDIVRDSTEWNSLQPAEDKWNFEPMDKIVNALHARGIEVQALLGYTARWVTTGDPNSKDWLDWNRVTPRREPFLNYATAMVDRYKDRVRHWEVWNEPDIGFWKSSTADYTELFKATSAAILKADPNAKVLNGGFAMVRRPPNLDFVQDFVREADASNWYVCAYHDYHTFGQMITRAKENAQYYKSKKLDIPIWINEGGFHTLLPGGEAEQAVNLAKKMAIAPALGVTAYIWYDLIDDGDKPLDPEHHFGLLRRDFSPKPAFIAYQQVIRELGPRRFAKKLPDGSGLPGLWGAIYQSPSEADGHVLVLWREGKGRETPVWIGGNGGAATSVRAIDGAAVKAPSLDGGLLVAVGDAPVYVGLRGSVDPTIRPVMSLPDKLAVLPGRANPFVVRVTNPTAKEATFAVTMTGDSPALRLSSTPREAKIAAGQTATITGEARLAEGGNSPVKGIVTVAMRPGADAPPVEARLPFIVASPIQKIAASQAGAIPPGAGLAMKLDTTESVVNLFSAEPVDAMHWHGPTDLSAAACLAYTDDALLIEVTATDDTHVQEHASARLWEGDSLQVALRIDDSRPEFFEAVVGLKADGKPSAWVAATPTDATIPLGEIESPASYDAKREGNQTRYRLTLPWKSLGVAGVPTNGFRLSFLVNDNDGKGRKGWVQLSDGIGKDKNPSLFTLFVGDGAMAKP